jgi:iron complex outermembrane receptor protein
MLLEVFLTYPTLAQDTSTNLDAPGYRLAQAETQRSFSIPAQSLADALPAFGQQAGLQITSEASIIAGLSTRGVSGSYEPEAALRILLDGTGLTYRFTDADTVMVEQSILQQQGGERFQIEQTTVEGEKAMPPTALIGNLPEPYAGGQVARGGRLGILGNRDIMDAPFSQMNYTSKLMQDQQAQSLGEVLRNDPSVQASFPHASGDDFYSIRGFEGDTGTTLFNGLIGIAPTNGDAMRTESIERIEVLRGPNALLSGAAGNVGGMINIVPKRAGDEPLIQLDGSYALDSLFGGHVDIGRRFGSDKQFGVRFNGVYRKGDTPIKHHSRESGLAALGLDYRGEILRLSSDLGYQDQEIQGARWHLNVAPGFADLPKPPSNRTNVNAPWEINDNR